MQFGNTRDMSTYIHTQQRGQHGAASQPASAEMNEPSPKTDRASSTYWVLLVKLGAKQIIDPVRCVRIGGATAFGGGGGGAAAAAAAAAAAGANAVAAVATAVALCLRGRIDQRPRVVVTVVGKMIASSRAFAN